MMGTGRDDVGASRDEKGASSMVTWERCEGVEDELKRDVQTPLAIN